MSSLTVTGTLVVAASLVDDDFSSSPSDQLTNPKRRHEIAASLPLTDSTNVVALSKIVHIAQAAGTITAVEITTGDTAPDDSDLIWTVEVMKSTGAGSFTTILSAPKDASTTARTIVNGSLAVTSYVDGDLFQIVVTVSGSTGTQGQGGCIVLWLDENPA